MTENNLKRLEQNLIKKKNVLDRLEGICDKQETLLESAIMDESAFDECMDELDKEVHELEVLNKESDELYEFLCVEGVLEERVRATQIEKIRKLIAELQNQYELLQKKQLSNKQKLEDYFQTERKNFGSGRRSSKVALDYYKSMNRSNVIPPQFMDHKK